MDLREGIKFINNTNEDIDDLLLVSDGVISTNSDNYVFNSFLPVDNWRKTTGKEKNILISEKYMPKQVVNNCLSIFSAPKSLINTIRESKIHNFYSTKEFYLHLCQNRNISNKIDFELTELIKNVSLTNKNQNKFLGFHITPPLLSTGQSIKINKFIGLHIDNSSKYAVFDFNRFNRILVNIGFSTRYFYFTNISSATLYKEAQVKGQTINTEKDLCDYYLKHYKYYPIFILKLKSGQGYIAPTENMLHDGSSKDVKHKDVLFSVIGKFNPLVKP